MAWSPRRTPIKHCHRKDKVNNGTIDWLGPIKAPITPKKSNKKSLSEYRHNSFTCSNEKEEVLDSLSMTTLAFERKDSKHQILFIFYKGIGGN